MWFQSLDRFSAPLASERPHSRPVAECLACGREIYSGQEYLEIWPGVNNRYKVCSIECARWAWHILEEEDRLHGDGWYERRIAEEVGAPWWD